MFREFLIPPKVKKCIRDGAGCPEAGRSKIHEAYK